MKHRRISSYLLILAAGLFLLGGLMGFMVYRLAHSMEHDARTLNELGRIRGSIQRAAKLGIDSQSAEATSVIEEINTLLALYLKSPELITTSKGLKNNQEKYRLEQLAQDWSNLSNLIYRYQRLPDSTLEAEIIRLSEQLWNEADAMVLTSQVLLEHKVSNIKVLYLLLFINGFAAINLFSLIFFSVREKLETECDRDPLTQTFNRRSYDRVVEEEVLKARHSNSQCTLLLLDIDFFKKVNDTLGHKRGDKILIEMSKLINVLIRSQDKLFRIGGEEFAIICPNTDKDGASALAEKIRSRIEQHDFGAPLAITVSLGITCFDQKTDAETLFQKADEALYQAKRSGRNTIICPIP